MLAEFSDDAVSHLLNTELVLWACLGPPAREAVSIETNMLHPCYRAGDIAWFGNWLVR